VPAIWIQSDFVGGCNDGPGIITLDKQGQLDSRLKAAGAL
jgi:glutaredoxin-related protein